MCAPSLVPKVAPGHEAMGPDTAVWANAICPHDLHASSRNGCSDASHATLVNIQAPQMPESQNALIGSTIWRSSQSAPPLRSALAAFFSMLGKGQAKLSDILLLFIYLEIGTMDAIYFKTT
jgi:hypothetical protein